MRFRRIDERAKTYSHVDHDGADGVRPRVVPERGDGRARSDGCGELRVSNGARVVAREVGVRRRRDRVVAGK